MVSLLVVMAPVSELLSEPRPLKSRGDDLRFALFIVPASLLVTGERFNVGELVSNSAVGAGVFPWAWLVWELLGRNWFLLTGLMVALAVMMIYWTATLVMADESWGFLLLPVLLVMLVGVFWAPLARWVLGYARRTKYRRMCGPGMQSLAMTTLFLPALLVAIFVPGMLQLSPIWSAVSLILQLHY